MKIIDWILVGLGALIVLIYLTQQIIELRAKKKGKTKGKEETSDNNDVVEP